MKAAEIAAEKYYGPVDPVPAVRQRGVAVGQFGRLLGPARCRVGPGIAPNVGADELPIVVADLPGASGIDAAAEVVVGDALGGVRALPDQVRLPHARDVVPGEVHAAPLEDHQSQDRVADVVVRGDVVHLLLREIFAQGDVVTHGVRPVDAAPVIHRRERIPDVGGPGLRGFDAVQLHRGAEQAPCEPAEQGPLQTPREILLRNGVPDAPAALRAQPADRLEIVRFLQGLFGSVLEATDLFDLVVQETMDVVDDLTELGRAQLGLQLEPAVEVVQFADIEVLGVVDHAYLPIVVNVVGPSIMVAAGSPCCPVP